MTLKKQLLTYITISFNITDYPLSQVACAKAAHAKSMCIDKRKKKYNRGIKRKGTRPTHINFTHDCRLFSILMYFNLDNKNIILANRSSYKQ